MPCFQATTDKTLTMETMITHNKATAPARWREIALRLLTYPLSALFAMAAATKVMKYATYRSYLHTSGLMDEGAAFWVSVGLPAAELAVAALVAWPRTRKAGLVAVVGLLPGYHYYIYYALNRATFLPCGCLGALPIAWEQHYVLNIIVLCSAVAALALQYTVQRWKHGKR